MWREQGTNKEPGWKTCHLLHLWAVSEFHSLIGLCLTVPPLPLHRGQDPLPGGPGSAEMHAGNPGETQVLPGHLRNHGAAASRAARVHEGGLPGAGGRESRVPHSFFLLSKADSALHQLFLHFRPLPSSAEITRAAINAWLLLQIAELPVTEKDIEKEHHAQLRRWKETHGDLRCKSPPRMHGAKAIMAAEPPSRQDLRQRPTIIVESPLAEKDEAVTAKTVRDKVKDTARPPPSVDPHHLSTDPAPLLPNAATSGSKDSLSSGEHDTYL